MQEIIGAVFSVPTCKRGDEIGASYSWFFTSPDLSYIQRIKVADRLIKRVHLVMKQAGFKQVITDMGTREGAKYLHKRFGYIHSPTSAQNNRWILELS